MIKLNTVASPKGARVSRERVGRGAGSKGKTCGRGHKGQKSRKGASRKAGFEGGQMPMQRRLPKFGFNSHLSRITKEIRLGSLSRFKPDEVVDIKALREANLISDKIKRVKIFKAGEITSKITLKGLMCTKGAKEAIIAAGGQVA